jgi:hypothetical protein
VGWVFVLVALTVMVGNVLNLLPLILAGYKKLKAKIKY